MLAHTRKEFGNFETLMGSMQRQVGTVQNTIEKLNTRTRAINRSLREVSVEDADPAFSPVPETTYESLMPRLVANEE